LLPLLLCRGKYAQLLAEQKPFTAEEEALFDASAQHAYESFRNKAASSRGMTIEAMQVSARLPACLPACLPAMQGA
jgi:protease-4